MALSVSEKSAASMFRTYLFYLDSENWGRNLPSAGTIYQFAWHRMRQELVVLLTWLPQIYTVPAHSLLLCIRYMLMLSF
jgi:hypothetical protein